MSTTTENASDTRVSEDHREALEWARDALYGQEAAIEDALAETGGTFAALEELASVSHDIHDLAVDPRDGEVGAGELDYATARRLAPMSDQAARSVLHHARKLERLRDQVMEAVVSREAAVQALARQLTGQGEDVDAPVLQALKELDLAGERGSAE